MYCLWCQQDTTVEINWKNLFIPDLPKKICEECSKGLEFLEGLLCKNCGRRSERECCQDCQRWEQDPNWKGIISFNQSAFSYNLMLQEIIAKWKYRGDYVLAEIFREAFQKRFKQTFTQLAQDTVLVPIPLSEERLYERGFNQAEALAQLLDIPYQHALTRIHGEKQSKKTRKDRLATYSPFQLKQTVLQPVILIDDIYTTGITIRHAAKQLKQHGCPQVYSYTLAR